MKVRKIHILFLWLMVLLSGLLLHACGSASHTPDSRKVVTVSLPPQKFLLDRIVGDRMEVRCLLGQGSDPESYEPGMSQMLNLEKSVAYFRIGHIGFEDAIIDKVKQACPDLEIFDNSKGVSYVFGTHGDESPDEVDPHIWSSPANVRIIAANMLRAAVSVDSVNAPYYEANFRRLMATVDSVDHVVGEMVEAAPSRSFVVWHPSLSYFARDYGLKQISLGAEHKESSVGDLRQRVGLAKESGARIFFMQQDVDSRAAQSIVSETGLKAVSVNPLNYRWDEEMVNTARALAVE